MKGETTTGFKFEVDEKLLEDWRLVSAISATESEDRTEKMFALKEIVNLLLGKKGEKDLIEHIKKKNKGYVPIDKFSDEIVDIISSLPKN